MVHNTTQETSEYIYEISEKLISRAKKSGDIVAFFESNLKLDAINIVCQNDEINR